MLNDKRKIENTNQISYRYLSNLLNIDDIKDNYLINDNNILIIEHKQDIEQKNEGLENLLRYANTAAEKQDSFSIYAMLGIGIDRASFKRLFLRYNRNDKKFEKETEIKICDIFSNSKQLSSSLQYIHDNLISTFNIEKQEDLFSLLTIIISSFVNDDLIHYYKTYKITNESETNDDSVFIDKLVSNAREILKDKQYEKYLTKISVTKFTNCFRVCKIIYDTYMNDPRMISKLFQQFKKYNRTDISRNQIWTESPIAEIMFREIDNLVENRASKITICDPCIGGGNLLTDFVNCYKNIEIKGSDIDSNLVMNNKLEYITKGIRHSLYSKSYFDIDDKELESDFTICNPPYTYKLSKKECYEFVFKSLHHSRYCCYILPKDRIVKEKSFSKCLEIGRVIKIIELGKIFKGVGTGDIIIILFKSLIYE